MFGKNSLNSTMTVKVTIIIYLILSAFFLAKAEASVSETITYSKSMVNPLPFPIPVGMQISISLSASISSTITITGPGGYSNTVSATGPGSSTREMLLGEAGTYNVSESHHIELTGSAMGQSETVTDDASAQWSFNNPIAGSTGTLSVSSSVGNFTITHHSDNIEVSVSGMTVNVTTVQEIPPGGSASASIEGIWTVTTSMSVSETPPETGIVQVYTNRADATFSVTGPDVCSGQGMYKLCADMEVGTYTATFGGIPGYITPGSQTKTLTANSIIVFQGVYTPIDQPGTVEVYTNRADAVFDVTGPESRSGSGTYKIWADMPPGTYTVTFHDIDGFTTPLPQTQTLTSGGSITFNGVYTAIVETGTVMVRTNLRDEVTFIVTSPGYTQADFTFEDFDTHRLWTLTGVPTGEHTIVYGDVPDHDTPAPETLTLTKGSIITFVGEYIRHTGTIQVQTNLKEGVTFTVTSPDYTQADFTFEDSDTHRLWTLTGVPTGEHTIVYGDVPDHDTPAPETLTLTKDSIITFVGEYIRHTGTILVNANLAGVTFSVTNSAVYTQADFAYLDGVWILAVALTGEYTIVYGYVLDYETPASETLTLTDDGVIEFTGEYVPVPPTISGVEVLGGTAGVGDTIVVFASGDRGRQASFSIDGIVSDVPMAESESTPGLYMGEYVAQEGDNAENAVVRVKFVGVAGTTAINEERRASIDTTPPAITSVAVSGSPARNAGDVITITLMGEPGCKSGFSIEGVADNILMTESPEHPGTYEGSYTAVEGLDVTEAKVTASLTDGLRNTNVDGSQSVSICTLVWDVNRDGIVDAVDIGTVSSNMGKAVIPELDLNRDGVIDMLDVLMVAMHYGEQCGVGGETVATAPFAPHTVPNYLFQNYPNPCNPGTWIPFMLAEGEEVTVSIYNSSGQLIRRLDLGYRNPGVYVNRTGGAYWDGSNESGEEAASGVYFYHIKAGRFSAVRKMLVSR